MQKLPLTIIIGLLFLCTTLAHAAQDAVVAAEQAAVRERPSRDAVVMESLSQGTKVRVSSKAKNGWFKTRSSVGLHGWIWQGHLSFPQKAEEENSTEVLNHYRHVPHAQERGVRPYLPFSLRGGGLVLGMFSSAVSSKLGLGKGRPYFASGGFIEAGYRVKEDLRLTGRFMGYTHTSGVLFHGVRYDVSHTGYPLLAGIEATVLSTERFDITGALYAGFSLSNKLEVSAPAFSQPNAFVIESVAPAAMLNFGAKYLLSRRWAAVFELAAYYSYIPKQRVPNAFNGDGPFRDDANTMTELRVNHLGMIAGVGVQFDF